MHGNTGLGSDTSSFRTTLPFLLHDLDEMIFCKRKVQEEPRAFIIMVLKVKISLKSA